MEPKRDIHQEITDKLISLIEAGTLPWRKDWTSKSGRSSGFPVNISSGKPYNGVNVVLLWCEAQAKGYASNTWGTYKQIKAAGGNVQRGSKATTIVFYKPLKVEDKKTGEDKTIPLLRSFNVFNLDQTDIVTPSVLTPETIQPSISPIQIAEDFIVSTKAIYSHGGVSAYYSPLADTINMPKRDDFLSSEGYYATFIHELTHWTGHKTRLDRLHKHDKRFGSESYAYEELVAELGSAFMCAELGIEAPIENHASYLASWLKVLEQDKKAFFSASAEASRAFNHLQDLRKEA